MRKAKTRSKFKIRTIERVHIQSPKSITQNLLHKIFFTNFCLEKILESYILSSEPMELKQKLIEWLPEKGNWSICWQATMDGWGSGVFHSKCDGKIPTLTVVKVVKNDKKYVFGGYATQLWAGSRKN